MRAGVTGASGHVGGTLVRELLNQGVPVRVLARKDTRSFSGLKVDVRKGDILDPSAIDSFVQGCSHVFHFAALVSLDSKDDKMIFRVNIEGTDNIIRACMKHNVKRLIYCSSIHAFSPYPVHMPTDENRELIHKKGMLMYDYTKAESERHIIKAVNEGLDGVIVNPAGIIGPYDYKPSYIGSTIIAFINRSFPALVGGGFNWVDVRDVAKGSILAARKGKKGERYILGGIWVSIKDLALTVKQVTGCRIPSITVPLWLARIGVPFIKTFFYIKGKKPVYTRESLYSLQHHRFLSDQKARRELGYSTLPFIKTINDTCGWFIENGYIKQ